MKKVTTLVFIALLSASSFAALPPQYQNAKDFRVISSFIEGHKRVISTLKSVDFKELVVHYGDDCIATFGRKARIVDPSERIPPSGPARPLEFVSSTCDVEWPKPE